MRQKFKLVIAILVGALVQGFHTQPIWAASDLPVPRVESKPGTSADNPTKSLAPSITKPETVENPYIPPPIMRDLSLLPFSARTMHDLLLKVAKSGDVEKLRPFIGQGDDVTMLSLGGIEGDPIDFVKTLSGDNDGHEVMAILAEVLEAGFVHLDKGTDQEMFVWPYFFAYSIEKLTPKQRVELFRIVTFGDFEDMKAFGAYIFYRVGITPKGRWRFFVAGD